LHGRAEFFEAIQLEDYALDLQDFHAASRDKMIVPILVASEADVPIPDWPLLWHGVTKVFCAPRTCLAGLIAALMDRLPERKLDVQAWESAAARPDAIDFRRNSTLVLLTRARYDMVIWLPSGDAADATREPKLFDATAAFLLACGAGVWDESEPVPVAAKNGLFD
jgi:hypothetical protein